MSTATPTPSIFDMNSLSSLKLQAKGDDPQALKAAAQQFEAVFVQMVLKSMRDATPHEGFFDSDQTRMYESLLDQQLAQVLSAKGSLGLAAMIEKQLSRQSTDPQDLGPLPLTQPTPAFPLDRPLQLNPLNQGVAPSFPLQRGQGQQGGLVQPVENPMGNARPQEVGSAGTQALGQVPDLASEFVAKVRAHAIAAEELSGIPAHYMVAQAALESGWGRTEPRFADGRQSFNLFGVKAGRGWNGPTVETTTTEYVNGVPQRQSERFRAYASYAEAFQDYAQLMMGNERYGPVLASRNPSEFAQNLQNAGYATDPQYANKLERVLNSPALRTLAG